MTGRVIAGRYNLQHPIGRGAMGVVWRARDQLLDRDVAVKEVMISALIGADERHNAYQRTLREARTAARLSHHGVVAVYDVAEEDGRPWIIMELVPSQSLDQVLTVDGRLSPLRAARIGQQLLSALAHAHSAGVLHRDVKPSNVLIANDRSSGGWEERAVLTDFGIAQFEGDPRLTQTGMVMGSPGFTAPERIRGGDATPASDLWSLGATLYAAVEGRGPYDQRGGAITTMSAIINEDAPAAAHAGRLAPLIGALLRREPRERPSAMAATVMFSQILPQLAAGGETPRAASHPPTMHSPLVPTPARPVASAAASQPPAAAPESSAAAPEAVEVPKSALAPAPLSAAEPTPTTPDDPVPALARVRAVGAAKAADVADAEVAEAEPIEAEPIEAEPIEAEPIEAEPIEAEAPQPEPADDWSADEGAGELAGDAAEAGAADIDDTADDDDTGADDDAEGLTVVAAGGPAPVAAPVGATDVPIAAEPGGDADDDVPEDDWEDDSAITAARQLVRADGADDIGASDGSELAAAAGVAVAASAVAGIEVAKAVDAAESGAVPATSVKPVSAAAPIQESADPAPAPTAKPTPTFTAARPGERSGPTFSAARPAASGGSVGYPPGQAGRSQAGWSQSGQPRAGWSQSGQPQTAQPQSGWAPSGGNAAGWAGQSRPGDTAPFPESGASYAGPSQDYPDLAAQYRPGSGGGRAARSGNRGRGRLVALVIGAIVIAAAIGAGLAFALGHHGNNTNLSNASNNTVTYPAGFTPAPTVVALDHPSSVLPTGWTTYTVTAAQAGTKAGFSIDLPPGWTEQRDGYATLFFGPGNEFMDVDLTTHTYSDMLTEAKYIEQSSMLSHPGYRRWRLDREPVLGTNGAFWKYTYDNSAGITLQANDILFIKPTPAGDQSYAIEFRTSNAAWDATVPRWEKILRTFQTVPASGS